MTTLDENVNRVPRVYTNEREEEGEFLSLTYSLVRLTNIPNGPLNHSVFLIDRHTKPS